MAETTVGGQGAVRPLLPMAMPATRWANNSSSNSSNHRRTGSLTQPPQRKAPLRRVSPTLPVPYPPLTPALTPPHTLFRSLPNYTAPNISHSPHLILLFLASGPSTPPPTPPLPPHHLYLSIYHCCISVQCGGVSG